MASLTQGYTVPPPEYAGPTSKSYGSAQAEPLLGADSQPASGRHWDDQPDDGDLPDDFKVGVTVNQSSASIRQAFVRKVYSILFIQIFATTAFGALLRSSTAQSWVFAHTWSVWVSLGGSLVSLGFLHWKRHSYPSNIVLLGVFTGFESFAVGAAVSFYDQRVVLQALVITLFVFLGLTLFTFQSEYDFSSMGPWLFATLLVFFFTGIVSFFFPFSRLMDGIYAGLGALLFSAYILYDTYMIGNRLSPDEWVIAVVSLYLDVINLFLMILRILNNVQSD